ncbi:MAG: hypothetical protein PHE80_04770 [Candidatus Omnitrophica bacterium]|nr:hypothetical protein [Candidatus Omnitrophota bacterium]MDD5737249.1 hypothetical protein [Candidatus Omnitrophota bacterium]
MTFKELMEEVRAVDFDTVRVDSYYYFEAVVLRDKVPLLKEKLGKVFGEPVCPAKKKLGADIQQAIEDFGGIRDDQVLYFLKDKEFSYFAMLWPWTDEYHTTVKVGRK